MRGRRAIGSPTGRTTTATATIDVAVCHETVAWAVEVYAATSINITGITCDSCCPVIFLSPIV
jgi:hypothetical protein